MKKKKVKVKDIAIDKKYPYKKLKDGSYKIYSWRITLSPSEYFPDMVTIEHTVLEISKRFITFEKAIQWIEKNHIETFLEKTGKKVAKELRTIGMGELITPMPEKEKINLEN